jgi:hypothetical protein
MSGSAGTESPWTPRVLDLLDEWHDRAAATAETHYALASRLGLRNAQLGIPVVVLTTFVGTSVFATLQDQVNASLRIFIGIVSVLAAVLASLQTFLRLAERAEKHRVAAEGWSSIRREIAEKLALHPEHRGTHDPEEYLANLRRRIDRIAAQSPEMGDRAWRRAERRFRLSYHDRQSTEKTHASGG